MGEMASQMAQLTERLGTTGDNLANHLHPNLETRLDGHDQDLTALRGELREVETVTTRAVADLANEIADAGSQEEPEQTTTTMLGAPAKAVEEVAEAPEKRREEHHHFRVL